MARSKGARFAANQTAGGSGGGGGSGDRGLGSTSSTSVVEAAACAQELSRLIDTGDEEGAEALVVSALSSAHGSSAKAFHHALVGQCTKTANLKAAMWCARRMIKMGMKPNIVTFNCLLSVTAKTGDTDIANVIWDLICTNNLQPNSITYNTMINVCAKGGKPAMAETWMRKMQARGIGACLVTYSVIISAHSRAGDMARAHALFEELDEAGLPTDMGIYIPLLLLCSRVCDTEKAEIYLRHLRGQAIEVDSNVLQIVDRMFKKAGVPHRGNSWIAELSCQPTPDAKADAGSPSTRAGWGSGNHHARRYESCATASTTSGLRSMMQTTSAQDWYTTGSSSNGAITLGAARASKHLWGTAPAHLDPVYDQMTIGGNSAVSATSSPFSAPTVFASNALANDDGCTLVPEAPLRSAVAVGDMASTDMMRVHSDPLGSPAVVALLSKLDTLTSGSGGHVAEVQRQERHLQRSPLPLAKEGHQMQDAHSGKSDSKPSQPSQCLRGQDLVQQQLERLFASQSDSSHLEHMRPPVQPLQWQQCSVPEEVQWQQRQPEQQMDPPLPEAQGTHVSPVTMMPHPPNVQEQILMRSGALLNVGAASKGDLWRQAASKVVACASSDFDAMPSPSAALPFAGVDRRAFKTAPVCGSAGQCSSSSTVVYGRGAGDLFED